MASMFSSSFNIPKISITLISLLIAITILISILSLFLTFFSNPNSPIIRLNSLKIPHLEITNAKIAGIWLGNLTIYNSNPTFELYMRQIRSSIYYGRENAISLASVDDLDLGLDEYKHVYVKFTTTGEQPILEYPMVREIERHVKERKKVDISMKMRTMGVFRSGWRFRQDIINVYCMDLVVLFNHKNKGELHDRGRYGGDCLVLIDDESKSRL